MRVQRRGWLLLCVAMLLAACSASAEVADTSISDAAVAAVDSAADASDNNDGANSDAPEQTPELTSAEVFDKIDKSIVYLSTPDGASSGSGIVVDGGWILTNAHVVERHVEARVGNSAGEDLGLYPVHAVDWIFDLAVLGPIDHPSLAPIERGVSADVPVGGRVLLAGFPDEDSSEPTPTLTEGIVSRRRYVELGDFPFLQVDATIAPGQSGGALVDGFGRLVGISGIEFGAGEFGLVFAGDAMWPRIDDLIAAVPLADVGGEALSELEDQLGLLRNFGFLIEVGASGQVDLTASASADIWIDLQTLGGFTYRQTFAAVDPFRETGTENQFFIDERVEGGETISAQIDPGTYQALIGSLDSELTDVTVTSSNELRRFPDIEEGAALTPGELAEGDFDWIRDTDSWTLDLGAGDDVTIIADGLADTVIVVRLGDAVIASSDDEGLGLFGTGSRVDFTSSAPGTYVVEVGTYDQTRWGYLIEVTIN